MKTFLRRSGNRPYKRLVVVSTEGFVTEPEYFRQLEAFLDGDSMHLEVVSDPYSSDPSHVLRRANDAIRRLGLTEGDDAWCVVDKDRWSREQLREIHEWAADNAAKETRGFVVSTPKFELWLLLHVEEVSGQLSSSQVTERIRPYLHDRKHIPSGFVTAERVHTAISRAEALVPPYYEPWPNKTGTTMFLLVRRLMCQPLITESNGKV